MQASSLRPRCLLALLFLTSSRTIPTCKSGGTQATAGASELGAARTIQLSPLRPRACPADSPCPADTHSTTR